MDGQNIENRKINALNAREAILNMQQRLDRVNLMNAAPKTKSWDVVRNTLATAKVQEALKSPKVFVNGKKFTILRQLGEGGYSTVYEVFDDDKKTYALKIVDLTVQSNSVKNELIREIYFLEKLKNCNLVVKAHDYELRETETEHKILLLMEKGDRDLRQILAEHRDKMTLTPTKLRYYWEQMLEAVQQLHENNIIHADLKPANFLLVQGVLKVIDFGLAVEITPGQDSVQRNFIVGTREYMAPETLPGYVIEEGSVNWEAMKERKVHSCRVSVKADVWALGIILYQAIYSVVPFASVPGGKLAKLKVISDMDIPVEFEKTNSVNPLLLDTMKRSLEKRPVNRASILELLFHPYLRPDNESEVSVIRICSSCKGRSKQMIKITQKRIDAFNVV